VRCLVLDCNNSEFIDVDSLVAAKPAETTDGSGISKV
jgi:hypothetical protein